MSGCWKGLLRAGAIRRKAKSTYPVITLTDAPEQVPVKQTSDRYAFSLVQQFQLEES